jgi:hypothetical protein
MQLALLTRYDVMWLDRVLPSAFIAPTYREQRCKTAGTGEAADYGSKQIRIPNQTLIYCNPWRRLLPVPVPAREAQLTVG